MHEPSQSPHINASSGVLTSSRFVLLPVVVSTRFLVEVVVVAVAVVAVAVVFVAVVVIAYVIAFLAFSMLHRFYFCCSVCALNIILRRYLSLFFLRFAFV